MISLILVILFAGLYSWLFSLINLGAWFWILWVVLGILCSVIGYLLFVLFMVYVAFEIGNNFTKPKYLFLRDAMSFGLILFNIDVKVEGRENIPNETFVLMGNHKDPWDVIIAFVAYNRIMSAVAKKELSNISFIKKLFGQFNIVSIDRENNREGAKALLEGIKHVKSGINYIIFPEGGVKSRETEYCADLKPGAIKLATKPNVPISPFTICGTRHIKARKHIWSKRMKIKIKIHEAVPVSYYEGRNTKEIGLYVESIIDSGVEDDRKEYEKK